VAVLSVVMVAPLLGLLGTVTGMIETFASLGEMKLFTQGGGVAGGIGEALLTTQMGLAVSIPGVIVGRLLDRRQAQLEDELSQLAELVRLGPLREAA
jgi:biopolymer transport protein ExbB